jgi:histidyl-tRNA synthetase
MTPTLARMVGARAGSLRKPIRWFSVPQLFRYERTQRGRLREHFQWNVDILGEDDIAADAEVLAVALDALRALGLGADDIVARFNDRRLLEALLTARGVPPTGCSRRTPSSTSSAASRTNGSAAAADEASSTTPRSRRCSRVRPPAAAWHAAARRACACRATRTSRASSTGCRELRARLAELGLGEFTCFDPAIVRGLAYYTGTVFEIFDRQGELRAICGGGRYDRLLASVGGADLPGVGFGMGDVVLDGAAARPRAAAGRAPPAVDVFIVAMGDAQRPLLLRLAQALRAAGRSVLYALKPAGVGKQLKEADARGARATSSCSAPTRSRAARPRCAAWRRASSARSADALLVADPARRCNDAHADDPGRARRRSCGGRRSTRRASWAAASASPCSAPRSSRGC